jgi:TolB protein
VLAGVGIVVIAAVLVIGAARMISGPAGSSASPDASENASASTIALANPSAPASLEPSAAASGGLPTSTTLPGGPFASSGAMAVVGNDGSLSLVDASGRSIGLSAPDTMIGFPAWSPDGTRIAAIKTGTEKAILVFDAKRAASGQPVEPVVIFRSSTLGAFYLSWTPDGRSVSFLAEETDGLSLRVAPADGSAPLDGSGPGTKIRSGNPFYFDWIGSDRLFAHVGTGLDAFLGEIGTNGASASPALAAPGDFRSPVVSRDRTFIGYVRGGAAGSAEVVLAARDGTNEHTMPVFGTAAVVFDPVGDTLASIGPSQPAPSPFTIPIGPVRLIDPSSGKVRTLVDGRVVSFWWSPDGKTIAALRIQPSPGGSSAASVTSSASPLPSASQAPTEIRLLFVDVASGATRSQRVVQPGPLFIDQFLTYFDQYALSHRVWAPDSSSLLLPVVDKDGTTRIAVVYPNGDPPAAIDGAIGFWSP